MAFFNRFWEEGDTSMFDGVDCNDLLRDHLLRDNPTDTLTELSASPLGATVLINGVRASFTAGDMRQILRHMESKGNVRRR